MALDPFVWFAVTLLITLCNVIFSIIVYSFLSVQKKLNKEMSLLRDVALYYSFAMIIALVSALGLLALIV